MNNLIFNKYDEEEFEQEVLLFDEEPETNQVKKILAIQLFNEIIKNAERSKA